MWYSMVLNDRGVPYALYGVNVELAQWLCTELQSDQSRVRSALCVAKRYKDNPKSLMNVLLEVLAGGLGHDFQQAERFMYEHWYAHVEIGTYPCPHLLAQYQSQGIFYEGYRDHVAHQLRVYLLGLYLYDRCQPIREAVLDGIEGELLEGRTREYEFFLRWLVAALAHDAGYVLENQAIIPEEKTVNENEASWGHFLKTLNEGVLAFPLAYRCGEIKDEVFTQMHEQLNNAIAWRPKMTRNTEDLALLPRWSASDQIAWDILDKDFVKAGFSSVRGQSPSKKYHEFTRTTMTDYDLKLWDHGVISALLVLKCWTVYSDFLTKLGREHTELNESIPSGQIAEAIKENWWGMLYDLTLYDASSAIALHNIDKRRYSTERRPLEWHGHGFPIELNISLTGQDAQPLAFLLRLCDSLQVWNRQRYEPIDPEERLLESKDVSIRANNDGVHVYFRSDTPTEHEQYDKLLEDLYSGLKEDDVRNLVHLDKEFSKGFKKKIFSGHGLVESLRSSPSKSTPQSLKREDKELVQLKVRCSISKNREEIEVGACRKPPDKDDGCPVRWQLLHVASESTRLVQSLYEVTTLNDYLSLLLRAISIIKSSKKDMIVLIQAAGDIVLAFEDIRKFFTDNFAGKREGDKDKYELRERMFSYISHRGLPGGRYREQVEQFRDAFLTIAENLSPTRPGKDEKSRRRSDAEALRILQKSDNANTLSSLYNHGVVIQTVLLEVIESLTMGISEELAGKLTQKDLGNLGKFISERIRNLPHNKMGGHSIWRTDHAGGRI